MSKHQTKKVSQTYHTMNIIEDSNRLKELITSNPESQMRIGIKEVEELVSKETKKRKTYAPMTAEEKVFLSY